MALPLWGPQASLEPLGSAGVNTNPHFSPGTSQERPLTLPLSSDRMAHQVGLWHTGPGLAWELLTGISGFGSGKFWLRRR